jgi:hypothetical protein
VPSGFCSFSLNFPFQFTNRLVGILPEDSNVVKWAKRGQATFSSPVQKTSLSPFWEFEGRAGPYQAQLIAESGLDNRTQYTLGEAAKAAGLVPQNYVCMAVPVTIQSKSVFFDRLWSVKKIKAPAPDKGREL